MHRARLSRLAQADIEAVLAWSAENFGEPAWLRYAALIAAGIRDIAAGPQEARRRRGAR
jgi:toxin ParE1/3/4